jgi:hypothetical protein
VLQREHFTRDKSSVRDKKFWRNETSSRWSRSTVDRGKSGKDGVGEEEEEDNRT